VAQQGDGSLLQRVRELLKLRRSAPVLRFGDTVDLEASNGVLRFSREYQGERVSAAFNFSDQDVTLGLLNGSSLLAGVDAAGTISALPQTLSPFSGVLTSS
jgi:glycosidase